MAGRRLSLSSSEFEREYPGEGGFIEFKRGVSGRQLQDTAVAFSNAEGGVILIGVEDDGAIAGRGLDAGTADDIHRALGEVRDVGRYELSQIDVDGRPVAVLGIARRREGFAQTSSGAVKVRRGTRDESLFGAELARFINERTTVRFEATPVKIALSACDGALLREVGEAHGWSEVSDRRLEEAGMAAVGQLTIAGALYLLGDPAEQLGKAYVEVARYPSDRTVDYDRREELRGPVHRVLRAAVARVADELGKELVVLGVRRYELPRLPELVVREAIANALAHRSYEAAGTAVRVELRPSAVVVRSPGGLPEPVTVENIREANAARNLSAIDVLRRFGLAEDIGRGVDLMQDTMAAQMLDPPRFEDRGHEVVVTLPIHGPVAPVERAWVRELEQRGALSGGDRIALVHAARGEVLTNSRIRGILGIGEAAARDCLQRLRDEGFLEQTGERGGARYRLSGSLRPPPGLRLSYEALEDVVERLAGGGPISNKDVREATGLERSEALSLLNSMLSSGRLRRTGARRGTRYHLP